MFREEKILKEYSVMPEKYMKFKSQYPQIKIYWIMAKLICLHLVLRLLSNQESRVE